MQLVDIGANLSHESFQHDYQQVLEDARHAGVSHIILTGTDLEHSQAACDLAADSPALLSATAGLHPHLASSWTTATAAQIAALAQRDIAVAVGETGLDYNRNFSPADAQRRAFSGQLELAQKLQKPLFLHQRDAHSDFHGLLKEARDLIAGGVVHCFTDTKEALRAYLDLDMYIGITGWVCDERRGQDLQSIVRFIPDDRLLIETDAPYLLPRSLRPKPKSRRNEPKYLIEVLRTLAQFRGNQNPEELARFTSENAKRLFRIELETIEN
jgi:TatD DNase family protein